MTATNSDAEQVYIVAIQLTTVAIFELGLATQFIQLDHILSVNEFV